MLASTCLYSLYAWFARLSLVHPWYLTYENRAPVALLWQHNANPSYKLASIPRYDDIVRTAVWAVSARAAGRWLASAGAFSKLRGVYGKCAWLAGRWLAVDGGVLSITAVAWTAGFHWWRSGNIARTQNVSEYMLVLALCLVIYL